MMRSYDAAEQQEDEFPIIRIEVPGHPLNDQLQNGRNGKGEDRKRGSSKRVAPDVIPKPHEHLLKSGPLGKCNDPLCTTCPAYFDDEYSKSGPDRVRGSTAVSEWLLKVWLAVSSLWKSIPGVINPHTKFMQRWNKVFVISSLTGVFVDPLFFFLLAVDEKKKCIVIDQNASTVIIVLRTITDLIFFFHILLQFRLAYVAPSFCMKESPSNSELRLAGVQEASEERQRGMDVPEASEERQRGIEVEVSATRNIVDDPKKIAWNYATGWFLFDLLSVLPLPQIMIKVLLPKYLGRATGANYAKHMLRVILLLQNVPRVIRVLPLLSGHSSTGFIFETAWANFVINLFLYLLAAHVVGSLWYLFGLQRVNQCLHNACRNATRAVCIKELFLDCGVDTNDTIYRSHETMWKKWRKNVNASQCFDDQSQVFTYGIYQSAVEVTTKKNGFSRYIYSVFWGFQQISTLAGNQIPSLFVWEVVFVMTVIALGLMLLTLLIGNMQNFLQSLGRRSLEMQLRRYEFEKWMTRRHLPLDLRRLVRQYERYEWAATRGLNEDELLQDLPEDLHRTIRKTVFNNLVKKVRILEVIKDVDEQLLDAIYQRLHQKLYIQGCEIVEAGKPVDRMLFIVHGTLESEGQDKSVATLHGGDICGEELLTWYLEHQTVQQRRRDNRSKPGMRKRTGERAISSRTVKCQTNVESFALEVRDLEEVSRDFDHLLRDSRVQSAIRYESLYLRSWAAVTIQVYWRRKRKKLGSRRTIISRNIRRPGNRTRH